MSLWKIAWRSIQQRALASFLTGLSIALGVALVVIVLVIHGVVADSFTEAAQGYNLIVGAKGGKLQLTLNTVFHLSQPIENIPYSYYKEFTRYKDEFGNEVLGAQSSGVMFAVPYCLGDSYKDFRVVGTTPDLFDKVIYGAEADGTEKHYRFSAGENFAQEDFRAAVIGAVAASKAGLKLGDRFPITHGLAEDENSHVHDEDAFHVVGILEPTGTPNDRAIFVNMEGFYLIGDHAKPVPKGDEKTSEASNASNVGADTQLERLHSAREQLKLAGEVEDVPGDASEHIRRAEVLVDEVIENADSGSEHHGEIDEEDHEHGHDEDDHDEDGHDKNDSDNVEHDENDHDENDHDERDHDEREHRGGHEEGHIHRETSTGHTGQLTPLPEDQREVTAILVRYEYDFYSQIKYNEINEGSVAQAVFPSREVTNLFEGIVGHIRLILLVLAVLVVLVAGIGVMVSIYNSMSDRSREIGIMRALGAGRSTVMSIVLFESILLALLGGLAGVIIGHGVIGALAPFITSTTGVMIEFWQPAPMVEVRGLHFSPELVIIPALILMAVLVGFLPALVAYRTDVARALSSSP